MPDTLPTPTPTAMSSPKGLYLLLDAAAVSRLTARELFDALRFEEAYPISNAPAGTLGLRKVDANATEPVLDRWRAFGVPVLAWNRNLDELLAKAARGEFGMQAEIATLTAPMPRADLFDLIAVTKDLMEAVETHILPTGVTRSPKELDIERDMLDLLNRAARVLTDFGRAGVKVYG